MSYIPIKPVQLCISYYAVVSRKPRRRQINPHLARTGYSRCQGLRFKGEWDAEKNPTRETAKLWIKFLQSNNNFPGGGAPALEHGAPSLAYYKDWVGKAQK